MKRHQIVAVIGGIFGYLLSIQQVFFSQQPYEALLTFIFVSIVVVSTFFKKDKMYPSWRGPRFVYIVLGFVCLLFILWIDFSGKDKIILPVQTQVSDKEVSGKAVSDKAVSNKAVSDPTVGPEVVDVPEGAPLRDRIVSVLINSDLKEEIKEGATPGKMPEPLTSLSKFQEYLVAQGMTEYKDLDLTNHYQKVFQKYFPGKVPSDMDTEMKAQLMENILEMGYEAGRVAFQNVPENAIWLVARFDPMGEELGQWTDLVLADDFGAIVTPGEIAIPSPRQATVTSPSPKDTEFPIPLTQSLPVEGSLEDQDPMETGEKNDPVNLQLTDRTAAEAARAEATLIKWLNAQDWDDVLSEEIGDPRFTPQQLHSALEIINRYGPEEGLRRIKESDPAVAKHLERFIDKNRRSIK